jgi:hypothetical protein
MTSPADTNDPVLAWQRLYLDAPKAAPSVAAAVAAAFRLADQVWRQVAADPSLDARPRVAVTGDARWASTALAAYQHLADTRAYAHLDVATQLRCWDVPATLRSWLTSRSDLPGFSDRTVAENWNIDDDFTWDADGIGARMATLIEQAQRAAVYGVPGYTIGLRQVTTDDPDEDPIVEHQVTLTTPSGAVLVSGPMPADHLADDDLYGVDAALALFANTATVVDELLAAVRHLVLSGIDVSPIHALPPRADRPRRGFTALDLGAASISPTAIEPPPGRLDPRPRR